MAEGLIIFGAVLLAFEVGAARLSRDSRDGNDWSVHERTVR